MRWIDLHSHGGHRGEYDWECSSCHKTDWFASYTNPNREGILCPHCGAKPQ